MLFLGLGLGLQWVLKLCVKGPADQHRCAEFTFTTLRAILPASLVFLDSHERHPTGIYRTLFEHKPKCKIWHLFQK